jgi:hypothetical protein
MLFKILDNLRSKPKGVRDQYSFLFAVGLTLIVGGFWTLSLPDRFNSVLPGTLAVSTSSVPTTPFANFFSEFKTQFANVKEAVSPSVTIDKKPATTDENPMDIKVAGENNQATSSDYVYRDPSQDSSKSAQTIMIATSSATTVSAY